jgi:alpha-tubulin suppressor-like RCC1 family protein
MTKEKKMDRKVDHKKENGKKIHHEAKELHKHHKMMADHHKKEHMHHAKALEKVKSGFSVGKTDTKKS